MKIIYGLVIVAVIAGCLSIWVSSEQTAPGPESPRVVEETMCTMDARQCPDGSYVGRTGPDCSFVCPALPIISLETAAAITAKADLITLATPVPLGVIESGVNITGTARGGWYFEGSFPIVLVNASGTVIAQTPGIAQSNWMTSEFVPFTATLTFTNPYSTGDPETLKEGMLILQKDNPSGLSENDDSLAIPVRFAP